MKTKIIVALGFVLCCCIFLSGCIEDQQEQKEITDLDNLVGQWRIFGENATVTFFEDGIYSSEGLSSGDVVGNWTMDMQNFTLTVIVNNDTRTWGYEFIAEKETMVLHLLNLQTEEIVHTYKKI